MPKIEEKDEQACDSRTDRLTATWKTRMNQADPEGKEKEKTVGLFHSSLPSGVDGSPKTNVNERVPIVS